MTVYVTPDCEVEHLLRHSSLDDWYDWLGLGEYCEKMENSSMIV